MALAFLTKPLQILVGGFQVFRVVFFAHGKRADRLEDLELFLLIGKLVVTGRLGIVKMDQIRWHLVVL